MSGQRQEWVLRSEGREVLFWVSKTLPLRAPGPGYCRTASGCCQAAHAAQGLHMQPTPVWLLGEAGLGPLPQAWRPGLEARDRAAQPGAAAREWLNPRKSLRADRAGPPAWGQSRVGWGGLLKPANLS